MINRPYIDFSFVEIYGPGCGELEINPEDLFERPCHFCDTYHERRDDVPFKVIGNEENEFLALWDLEPIFSENFLRLLTEEERSHLGLTRAEILNKEKIFFELRGPALANAVGVRDFPGFEGFKCPKCGHQQFTFFHDYQFYLFIAREDLPQPIPSCFLANTGAHLTLCLSETRWNEISDASECEDLIAEPVGIVDKEWIIRNPKVPILQRPRKLPRNVDEHCPPKDKRIDEAY